MNNYRKKKNWTTPLAFSTPLLICIIVYMILPFLLTFIVSFTNLSLQNLNNVNRTPRFVGFENYIDVWDKGRLLNIIWRTYIWMAGSVIFGILVGAFYAVVMSFDIKGKNILKAVILMPWVLPEIVTGYVMKLLFMSDFGVLWNILVRIGLISEKSTMLANPKSAVILVIVANVWRAAPYVAIMLYGKLKTLPANQIEAAKIDGANAIQRFIYITIPWIWSIMKRCALLLFVWSFNAYSIIYSMTNGGPANATTILPIALRTEAFGKYAFGKGAAYGVIILLTILITMYGVGAILKISMYFYKKIRR